MAKTETGTGAGRKSLIKSITSGTFKVLGTGVVGIGTAFLTKLRLAPDAKGLQEGLQQLPPWVLGGLLVVFPVAWLVMEFLIVCFLEVRAQALEHGAPTVARWLTGIPGAIREVLGRGWDLCLAWVGLGQFDGRYKKRLAEECERLHAQTGLLHATASFPLEKAYTELNMASTQYGKIRTGLLSKEIRGKESIYSFLRAQKPGTVLALLGRPGGGKTTLLRHLALLHARNGQGRHRLRRKIPILIELRRVTELFTDKPGVEWKSPSLVAVVEHYWKQHASLAGLMKTAPRDWLRRRLASGRVLVMVDGLDEVPHETGGGAVAADGKTPRQRVSAWMEQEMQREGQRDCLYLITSRPGGFAEAPLENRSTVVEVQPMTLEQSERFIHAFQYGWHKKLLPAARHRHLEREAARTTRELVLDLQGKPHLQDLRVNPLLLHMVCLLHADRGRLPDDRADLYKETCEVLLNRSLRAKGYLERMRPLDKMAALMPLANHFMRSESPKAKPTAELLKVIEPVFETLPFPAQDFFDFMAKDSGLLLAVEEGYWDFAHKTFYEYLAAEYWKQHPPTPLELARWVGKDWWRVTLLFYSAASEDSPVIKAALASPSEKAFSLAFECLNAGHRLNKADRALAEARLKKALADPRNEETFVPAARAFMDLRMRELVPASPDGRVMKRRTLVTQAEYQLFLYSLSHEDGLWMVPPHRKSFYFEGDPEAPVVGVPAWQVWAFMKWVKGNLGGDWRIPYINESHLELPDNCWIAPEWVEQLYRHTGQLDFQGCVKVTDAAIAALKATDLCSKWSDEEVHDLLGQLLWELRVSAPTLRSVVLRFVSFFRVRIRETTARIKDELKGKPRTGWRDGRIVLEFLNHCFTVGRGWNHVYAGRLRPGDLVYLWLADIQMPPMLAVFLNAQIVGNTESGNFILFNSSLRLDVANALKKLPQTVPDVQNVGGSYDRWLASLKAVDETQTQIIRHRHACIDCGLATLDLLAPYLNAGGLACVREIKTMLKLLKLRAEGKLQPWECIQLVKDWDDGAGVSE